MCIVNLQKHPQLHQRPCYDLTHEGGMRIPAMYKAEKIAPEMINSQSQGLSDRNCGRSPLSCCRI